MARTSNNWIRDTLLGTTLAVVSTVATADKGFKTASDVLAFALPAVAAGTSLVQDDTAGLFQLARAEAATLATTALLKLTVHETRPNGRDDKSFPSGHTSVAFAAAQYMQMRGGSRFGVPAYMAATLVGYSRVRADEHHWKDVLAGAAIGIASSYYFTDRRGATWRLAATPTTTSIVVTSPW